MSRAPLRSSLRKRFSSWLSTWTSSWWRSSLSVFTENGRRAGGTRSETSRAASKPSAPSKPSKPSQPSKRSGVGTGNGAIREWARANGHTVSERGRIKADVVQAYQAANGTT